MTPAAMVSDLSGSNGDLRAHTGSGRPGLDVLLGGPGQPDRDGGWGPGSGGGRFLRNPAADPRRAAAWRALEARARATRVDLRNPPGQGEEAL